MRRLREEDSEYASRLDFAFVSPNVRVEKAWMLSDMCDAAGIPISDHLPLLVRLTF